MHTLIYMYNFVPHTLTLAQACRYREGLIEETEKPGFESWLFPSLWVDI